MSFSTNARRHRMVGRSLAPLVLVALAMSACGTTAPPEASSGPTTTGAGPTTTGAGPTTTGAGPTTTTAGPTTTGAGPTTTTAGPTTTGAGPTTTTAGPTTGTGESSGTTTDDSTTGPGTGASAVAGSQLRQLTFNMVDDWNHGFSPDGSRIAFSSDRDGDREIFVMNVDGTGVVQLTHNYTDESGGSWSPDGSRIAFSSDRDGDFEIFVMNVDGTGVVQLTRDDALDRDPQWSPDGSRISFTSDRDGDFEIFVMNADGTDPLQLTDNDHNEWTASWSPDGTRIAFDSDRDGDFEIFVMNVDGTGVIPLTGNDKPDYAPRWSPDGTRIVFGSDPDHIGGRDVSYHGALEVMIMNADGSGLRPLTRHTAYDWGGSWSPDSTLIAFTSDRDGDREIFIIGADGSDDTGSGDTGGGNPDREPDSTGQAEAGGGAGASSPGATVDFLGYWPVDETESCGSWFRYPAPGDSVWIGAEGFAPNSVVEFLGEALSLQPPQGKPLEAPQLPATEADFEGAVQVLWTIPAAPPADEDSAPRVYAFQGTGVNDAGGTHTASMLSPVVAYPAAAPCAQDDEASTTFGEPVEIAVLDNDVEATANTETRLERTERPHGGTFSADTATGIVTFQPKPGFTGTASAHYFAYDSWNIRTRGRIEVEVRIVCSIDGSAAGAVIVGTGGDDVICVPDRRDDDAYDFYSPGRAFDYVVDAGGGDDIVFGGDGSDLIYGGEGADTIYGHGGRDTLVGGPGADTIHADEVEDLVYSLDSEDTITDVLEFQIVDAPLTEIYWPAPFTRNDWASAAASETIIIDVLANDYDINGDIDAPSLRVLWLPLGTATAVRGSGGGVVISYTAPDRVPDEPPYEAPWIPAQSGLDNFQYEICDARGACSYGAVFIRISRPRGS